MLRTCLNCGEVFEGRSDATLCSACAEQSIHSVIRTRTCSVCGIQFPGGPSAKYCPDCRKERERERNHKYKQRRREGRSRKLGSTDLCEVCGKEYTVTAGLQKYCPDCAAEAIAAKDRIKSREWNAANIDYDKRREDRQKATAFLKCVICGTEFQPDGGAPITCSPECSAALQKKNTADYQKRNREKVNENARKRLTAKISAMSPEELKEYREKTNARNRENYKKRKEKDES